MVLVATKADLQLDVETVARLGEKGLAPLTTEQGQQLAKAVGAAAFVECSALTQKGLKSVFDEAARAHLRPLASKKKAKKQACALL